MSTRLVGRLAAGPLDIIGDVHGEIAALDSLLAALGYRPDGQHPGNRRLVFLGDLVDRGPDSPAVLERVSAMVAAGRAQCLLGNHELNLLREVEKHGNSWWVEPEKPMPHPARRIDAADKERFRVFLHQLPLVLEREDLRVVHACWHQDAVTGLRRADPDTSALDAYRGAIAALRGRWERSGTWQQYLDDWRRYGESLKDPQRSPPLLQSLATIDSDNQMANPVAILTSGAERPAGAPFWAGNRWRMVERVRWWESYTDAVPVVVGHYWRRYSDAGKLLMDEHGPDLFAGIEPHQWMGPQRNVYCVDFSVGGRYVERTTGLPPWQCRLAALRVPEWRVVHDDGECWEIGPPG